MMESPAGNGTSGNGKSFENEAEQSMLIKESRAQIPTNQEIISLIPSKAVRDYLAKIGHEFSERERFILKHYLAPKNDDELNSVWEKGRYVSLPHPSPTHFSFLPANPSITIPR